MKTIFVALFCAGAFLVSECAAKEPLAGTAFIAGQARDGADRIQFYLAPSAGGPRPLLVVLQGSGCGALFEPDGIGFQATAGQDILYQLAHGRFAVLVVEKPGVRSEEASTTGGQVSNDCSDEFRSRHSLEDWTRVVSRAINAARRDPAIDGSAPIDVLGLSEGAIVAARLSATRRDVGRVAFISGFGCDQWSDVLVVAGRNALAENAEASAEEKEAAVAAAIGEMEEGFRAVAANPTAPDQYFDGQSHLFWSTFGKACPAADLAKTTADVFVAYGTQDEQVDPNGVEAIPAARIAAGKSIRMRRVLGGNHVLDRPGDEPFATLVRVFAEALDWMEPKAE